MVLFRKAKIGRGKNMKLKPKSTVHNPLALVFRRFTVINESFTVENIYMTVADNKYWVFDNQKLSFIEVDNAVISTSTKVTNVFNYNVLQYQKLYFKYNGASWESIEDISGLTLLSALYNNVGKYQTNKYYFSGSFDYMIKGSIEGTTSQYIKGNILPLTSLNIKYFDDDISLSVDDLVVIDGKLYSVEDPETTIKQQPKPFKIYFATLNSIL